MLLEWGADESIADNTGRNAMQWVFAIVVIHLSSNSFCPLARLVRKIILVSAGRLAFIELGFLVTCN